MLKFRLGRHHPWGKLLSGNLLSKNVTIEGRLGEPSEKTSSSAVFLSLQCVTKCRQFDFIGKGFPEDFLMPDVLFNWNSCPNSCIRWTNVKWT